MKTKPKFHVGQVILWKRQHPYDSMKPVFVEKVLDGYLSGWRYKVTEANSSDGWPENRFRALTKREAGL